jgi:hypothetical protein
LSAFARACRLTIAAAACIALASCIGLKLDAKIAADGKVDAALEYSIPLALVELVARPEYRPYLPLPFDRAELAAKASAAGAELSSWESAEGSEYTTVSAKLKFPSVQSFASFFASDYAALKYSASGGVNTLSATLVGGRPRLDADFSAFLDAVFPDRAIEFGIELPRPPRSSKGFMGDRNKLRFSRSSNELFAAKDSILLEFSW